MNDIELVQQRLINQHLVHSKHTSVSKLVSYFGAIQAQDFSMSKWAVGARTINSTQTKVEAAFNKGQIVRTHVLRPTWHLIYAEDIYWMLALTASNIKTRMRTNDKKLGLDEKLFTKSNKILEKVLNEHSQLNRDELIEIYTKHKIALNENRLSHFLMRAELEAIICSGKIINNKNTYALIDTRVIKKKTLHRDEALGLLAKKYVESRGPATLADFIWWSGLSVSDAKKAIHLSEQDLEKESFNNNDFYFTSSNKKINIANNIFVLPAFDEFLISYKDRSLILHVNKKNITSNGIFWPVILIDGKVAGMWSRKIENQNVIIKTDYFSKPTQSLKHNVAEHFKTFGKFLDKQLIVDGKRV